MPATHRRWKGVRPGEPVWPGTLVKGGKMMETKSWKFRKGIYDCIISIIAGEDVRIIIDLSNGQKILGEKFKDGTVIFSSPQKMKINGEIKKVGGFKLDSLYDEIKSYYDESINYIKEREKKIHDEEYKALMSGQKELEIFYHDGEYLSGYQAVGVSAEIVEKLHCGHYVDGWGVYVDNEFSNRDIEAMKRHGDSVEKEMAEKERKRQETMEQYVHEKDSMLDGVSWDITKKFVTDEGGKTIIYHHTLIVDGKSYEFDERNIFDFGRVINPFYSVSPGIISGGLAKQEGDKFYWQVFRSGEGWLNIREITGSELQAYLIVLKYGEYVNAEIRM